MNTSNDNWASQEEMICFVNNFLISQGFEFPYKMNSDESSQKNSSIVCSLTHRLAQSQRLVEDLEGRLRRLAEDSKEASSTISRQKLRIEQLEKDVLNSENALKLANESNQRLQTEICNVNQELARFRSQAAAKEKTIMVDLRKKEREMERLKNQMSTLLKNGYKQFGASPFLVSPSPKAQIHLEKNSTKEQVAIWKDINAKLEERNLANGQAFENLKIILTNVYFALCEICSQQPIDLLSCVQLNAFDEKQTKMIVDSIARLFEQWHLQRNKLVCSEGVQKNAMENAQFQALISEKEKEIETHKRLLRLAMTNESVNLQAERREIQQQKMEIEERTARMEEDRRKLVEMTMKFAQEKQTFLKEKLLLNNKT